MKYRPTIYKKNIHSINYKLLKENGITCLIFDLDNTLALISEKECPVKTEKLIKSLKKDFAIYIISNNIKSRIKPYTDILEIEGISFACKPSTKGLKKIVEKGHKKETIAMIGDQMMTDVLSANKFGVVSILVDPLGKKDLKITTFNRLAEQKIVKEYTKKNIFREGSYYE